MQIEEILIQIIVILIQLLIGEPVEEHRQELIIISIINKMIIIEIKIM